MDEVLPPRAIFSVQQDGCSKDKAGTTNTTGTGQTPSFLHNWFDVNNSWTSQDTDDNTPTAETGTTD